MKNIILILLLGIVAIVFFFFLTVRNDTQIVDYIEPLFGAATIKTYVESPVTPANSSRIGDTTTNWYVAQQFTTTQAGTIDTARFFIRIIDGSPTDGLTCEIWTDNGSNQPNTVISGATVNIPHASVVDGANSWSNTEYTTCTFASPPTVTDATKYWIVVYRQGSADASNYYNMWRHPNSGEGGTDRYSGGIAMVGTSGASWTELVDADFATEIDIADAAGGTVDYGDIIIFE